MLCKVYVSSCLLFYLQNLVYPTNSWDVNVEKTQEKKCNMVTSKQGDFKVVEKDPGTKFHKDCVNDLVLEKDSKKYCLTKGSDLLQCKIEGK